jgi:D-alanine-D-alanine ligase
MRIGMTYDLRSEYLSIGYGEQETAEFDREDTIEALEKTLSGLGHRTERIGHARSLIEKLAAGRRWDLVFNIAEGIEGFGREAQVPAILDVYGIPYTFSDPLVMALTLHKGMTKHVLRDAGVATADFVVVDESGDTDKVAFSPPYFIKPVAEGTGKGVTAESIVHQRKHLAAACRDLMAAFRQPVLVEPFLPGREFTIGIVGTGHAARVLGTMEVHLQDKAEAGVYSYTNKAHYEELVVYRRVDADADPVVRQAEAVVLQAWRVLGCRDAGRADVRCDAQGDPQFMEVNPLAGLHPEHSDLPILCTKLGVTYAQLIDWIVQSAQERIQTGTTHERSQTHAYCRGL